MSSDQSELSITELDQLEEYEKKTKASLKELLKFIRSSQQNWESEKSRLERQVKLLKEDLDERTLELKKTKEQLIESKETTLFYQAKFGIFERPHLDLLLLPRDLIVYIFASFLKAPDLVSFALVSTTYASWVRENHQLICQSWCQPFIQQEVIEEPSAHTNWRSLWVQTTSIYGRLISVVEDPHDQTKKLAGQRGRSTYIPPMKAVAFTNETEHVFFFSLQTLKIIKVLNCKSIFSTQGNASVSDLNLQGICFHPEKQILVVANQQNSLIHFLDLEFKEVFFFSCHPQQPSALIINPENDDIITSDQWAKSGTFVWNWNGQPKESQDDEAAPLAEDASFTLEIDPIRKFLLCVNRGAQSVTRYDLRTYEMVDLTSILDHGFDPKMTCLRMKGERVLLMTHNKMVIYSSWKHFVRNLPSSEFDLQIPDYQRYDNDGEQFSIHQGKLVVTTVESVLVFE